MNARFQKSNLFEKLVWNLNMSSSDVLAKALAQTIQTGRAAHTTSQRTVNDKMHRPEVLHLDPLDPEALFPILAHELLHAIPGQQRLEPLVLLVSLHKHANVDVRALVSTSRQRNVAQRPHRRRPKRRELDRRLGLVAAALAHGLVRRRMTRRDGLGLAGPSVGQDGDGLVDQRLRQEAGVVGQERGGERGAEVQAAVLPCKVLHAEEPAGHEQLHQWLLVGGLGKDALRGGRGELAVRVLLVYADAAKRND